MLAYEFGFPARFVPWPGRALPQRTFLLLDLGVSMNLPCWREMVTGAGDVVPGIDRGNSEPTTWYVDLVHVIADEDGIVVRDLSIHVMVPTDGRHQRMLDLDEFGTRSRTAPCRSRWPSTGSGGGRHSSTSSSITTEIRGRDGRTFRPWRSGSSPPFRAPGPVVTAPGSCRTIGVDMTVFPTAAHLVYWAKWCPQVARSGGKCKGSNATGRGNRYLSAALGEASMGAGRTDSFLGAKYRRLNKRMPKNAKLSSRPATPS